MTVIGYDPTRVERLRRRAVESVSALTLLRSADPGASDALRVAAQVRRHLEDEWLPLLDAILSSTAMIDWRTTMTDAGVPAWLGGVVGRLGAPWITSTGLEDVALPVLLRDLSLAGETFHRAALAGPGDAVAAWNDLDVHLAELARRIHRAPRLAAEAWGSFGPDGLADLVVWQSKAIELSRRGLLGDTSADSVTARSTASLAVVLGALTRHTADATDVVIHLASSSEVIGAVVDADPGRFGSSVLVAVTAELVAAMSSLAVLTAERSAELTRATTFALRAIATEPAASLDLARDETLLREIVTSTALPDDDIERFVSAALDAPRADTDRSIEGLSAIAALVRFTADSSLNAGARRGVAGGLGPYLGAMTTQLGDLDAETIFVPVGRENVWLGRRADLERLIGQVLDDVDAQLLLGVTASAFRAQQTEGAIRAIRVRAGDGPAACRGQLAEAFDDVDAFRALLEAAGERQESLHALQHGLAVGQATMVLNLVTLGASAAAPPIAAARVAVPVLSKAVAALIGGTEQRHVPSTSLAAEQSVHEFVTSIELPARRPDLRQALGLGRVTRVTWEEISRLLDAVREETDPVARAQRVAELRHAVEQNRDLAAYEYEMTPS
jgi:hypothetical protein